LNQPCLAPGAEYFVFAYSQHRFTNRQAVPFLIARDQVSGHWILAASPPTSTTDALRAVSWNRRSGQPAGSKMLLREPVGSALCLRRPGELVIATTDWSYFESADEPAQFWEPLILPPDFASLNLSSAAMSYYKPHDGNEWLAWRSTPTVCCAPVNPPLQGLGHDLSGVLPAVLRRQLELAEQELCRHRHAPRCHLPLLCSHRQRPAEQYQHPL
jgi:hypothetical protein